MSIQLEKKQSGFDGPLKKAFAVGTGGVHVALWKRQGGGGGMIDEIETPVSRLRKLPTSESILRLPQVKERVGLSRSTIYARIAEGIFPGPINLGGNSVGWIDSEVSAWIAERIAASRPGLNSLAA
jgi:prophage regulatory protein